MCAAPSNAFRTKSLKATKGSTTIDCLIAIPTETAAVLKARFYLDEILAVDEYDSAGAKIAGFIGACRVGSANHAMHNTARHFTLDGTNNGQLDFFNDAGLNTLGIVLQPAVPGFDGVQAVFDVTVIAAYFVNTDGLIMNYSINGGTPSGDIEAINGYSVPARETQIKAIAVRGVKPDDVLSITFGNMNAEGTHRIGPFSYTIPFFLWSLKGPATWPSQSVGMSPQALYPASFPVEVGTIIKPTTDGTFVRIYPGYYSDDNFWYQISDNNAVDSEVLSMGQLGQWPSGDPAYVPETPVWITVEFVHFSLDAVNGCIEMNTTGYVLRPRTIYWNTVNNIRYQQKDTSGPLAAAGVYYNGTKTGDKWNWTEIGFSGESLGGGTCT